MLRSARLALLRALRALRLDEAALRTRWRGNRLLILGYHGVALDDEHEWDPELYMPAPVLRRRLELIREAGCHVLSLDDAVRRLYEGDLPPRSVVLTCSLSDMRGLLERRPDCPGIGAARLRRPVKSL